ncbi:MAG TPA: hypothetical protein VIN59_02190 [Alphaproteobacteria bacterium]
MSVSDEFKGESALRQDRRKTDEAHLNKWFDSHEKLASFMKAINGLSSSNPIFKFEVLGGFEPAIDKTDAPYVTPTLFKKITFVSRDNVSNAMIQINMDGQFTFDAEETKVEGNTRAELLHALDSWVAGLHSAEPDLNIAGHLKRAQMGTNNKDARNAPKAA